MKHNLFTAYKVTVDGNQHRRDYQHNLTKKDVNKLPCGPQSDHIGEYIWSYGINEGMKI